MNATTTQGKQSNKLNPIINKETGEVVPESESNSLHNVFHNKINSIKPEPVDNDNLEFTIDHFQDIGRAVCWGLLDMLESNPLSRIEKSEFKKLSGVKRWVERYVEDKWGIDEHPEFKPVPRAAQSLPRVALLKPKHMDDWKKFIDRQKEVEIENKRKRERLDRIRKEYLIEMKERREKELIRNIDDTTNNTSEVNGNTSETKSSFKSYAENSKQPYNPYEHSSHLDHKTPPRTETKINTLHLDDSTNGLFFNKRTMNDFKNK